jgi:hypothetical protein
MKKQLDSAFVQRLVTEYRGKPVWKYLERVLPIVVFEVLALGPQSLIYLGLTYGRVRLDDGLVYKIKFVHEVHALVLYRMNGKANGDQIAVFTNDIPQADIWAALHPAAMAAKAA